MKDNLPSFLFYHKKQSRILDVILHGGSSGIDSAFIQKIFNFSKDKGHSVIAFNFPYFERGEECSSGPKLKEEIATLRTFLQFSQAGKYSHIWLIGKSLGGIVLSYFLREISEEQHKKFTAIILGYVKGDIDLKKFTGKIFIIQGQKDKFGDIKAIKEDIRGALSKDINYYEVKNADHSFRDPETKEPFYEDEVIRILQSIKAP